MINKEHKMLGFCLLLLFLGYFIGSHLNANNKYSAILYGSSFALKLNTQTGEFEVCILEKGDEYEPIILECPAERKARIKAERKAR